MSSRMRSTISLVALTILNIAACQDRASSDAPPTGGNASSSTLPAAAIAAQTEANEYFYAKVIPRLAPCWKMLKGQGVVEFRHAFRPADRQWSADTVSVESTTLAADQAGAATACMQEAVKGTAMAMATDIGGAPGLIVYWQWPVPLPDSAGTSPPSRMIIVDGGDGDTLCNKCMLEACPGNQCPKRDQCSGRTHCTVTDSGDGTLQCNFQREDRCTQGHYGLSGDRMFIY